MHNAPTKSDFDFELPLSVSIRIYLWIHSAKSLAMQIDGINHSDDGGIDRRIGTADGGHGGETFRGKQNAVADARVHGVEREDGIAAIRAVELKRLDDEDLARFVRGHFLRGNHIANDTAD